MRLTAPDTRLYFRRAGTPGVRLYLLTPLAIAKDIAAEAYHDAWRARRA